MRPGWALTWHVKVIRIRNSDTLALSTLTWMKGLTSQILRMTVTITH